MKKLTKDVFYVRRGKIVRLWHTCEKRKNFRMELTNCGTSRHGNITFKCKDCGFQYNLDPNLQLLNGPGGVRR